jgi:putative transposase
MCGMSTRTICPLVLDLAAGGIRGAVTRWVLGLLHPGVPQVTEKPCLETSRDNAFLLYAAWETTVTPPRRDYRFIAEERPGLRHHAGGKWAARICREQRIWSVFAKKRGLSRKAGPPVHDDRATRRFTATASGRRRLRDITELPPVKKAVSVRGERPVFHLIAGIRLMSASDLAASALPNAITTRLAPIMSRWKPSSPAAKTPAPNSGRRSLLVSNAPAAADAANSASGLDPDRVEAFELGFGGGGVVAGVRPGVALGDVGWV